MQRNALRSKGAVMERLAVRPYGTDHDEARRAACGKIVDASTKSAARSAGAVRVDDERSVVSSQRNAKRERWIKSESRAEYAAALPITRGDWQLSERECTLKDRQIGQRRHQRAADIR